MTAAAAAHWIFSNEWALYTHTHKINSHSHRRACEQHFDEKFRLFVIDSPFIVPFQLCTRLSFTSNHSSFIHSFVCVHVCFVLFVCLDDFFLSPYFWQKKKSFGMLADCRKWILLDVHVYVCGWFFSHCFLLYIPFRSLEFLQFIVRSRK